MDVSVNWSPAAVEDLEEIAEYIARDSRRYATSFVTRVLSIASQIERFPYSGRIVPELNNELIRERFVYQYRLIYRILPDSVLILSLIHGKRLLPIDDL
ncbi:MAG: type II toxin-antitoxin system RelE/ParE family toxin [Candidatus Hydrogenedentes bacterium]|nr:type II toxin-antitoxin system RelE/ParE family toxin [Candidatus Hydrogenedentota bacterium]